MNLNVSINNNPSNTNGQLNDLLSPFSKTNTDTLSLPNHDINNDIPVGVYWIYDPESSHPPRYAPEFISPASIRSNTQTLVTSLESSIQEFSKASTSKQDKPLKLGKRAVLSLLYKEELFASGPKKLNELEKQLKRANNIWERELTRTMGSSIIVSTPTPQNTVKSDSVLITNSEAVDTVPKNN